MGAAYEDGPSSRSSSRVLPPGLVKLATLSIIPWLIGSLLSPFGQPHPVLLGLTFLSLVVLLAATRHGKRPKRVWPLWILGAGLGLASFMRFIVLPVYGLLVTGGGEAAVDFDAEDLVWHKVMIAHQSVHILFYLAAAGLTLGCSWLLIPRGLPRFD